MIQKVQSIALLLICLFISSWKSGGKICVDEAAVSPVSEIVKQYQIITAWLAQDLGKNLAASFLSQDSLNWMSRFTRNLILANAANRGIAMNTEEFARLPTLSWRTIVQSRWGERLIFQKGHERLELFIRFAQEVKIAYEQARLTQNEMTAVLAQFIVNNQVFGDGNHRTGLAIALSLVEPPSHSFFWNHEEYEKLKKALNQGVRQSSMDFFAYRDKFYSGPSNAENSSKSLKYWLGIVKQPNGILSQLEVITERPKESVPVKNK